MNNAGMFSAMLVALLTSTSLHAQSRPDFTGRWILAPGATATIGGGAVTQVATPPAVVAALVVARARARLPWS